MTSGNKLAREFGIVFQLPEELRPIYASYGLDLRSVNADATFELPLTATYVIDQDQKIRFAFVDADYTKRMEPEEIVGGTIGNEKGGAPAKVMVRCGV